VTLTPTPSGATTVAFNSLGRPVDPASSLTSILFDVPDTLLPADKSRELRVNVGAGGGIRMCDPNAKDTTARKDTRAC
jgi:type IV fimbrial biogenesis protein FimT